MTNTPEPTAPATIRTIAEQKDLERRMRIKWLKSLMALEMNVADMARFAGMERTGLVRMFKLHGLKADRETLRQATIIPKYQEHLDAGRTMGEVAEILGVTRSAVLSMEKSLDGKFRRVRKDKRTNVGNPSNVVKLTASPKAINQAIDRTRQERADLARRNFG